MLPRFLLRNNQLEIKAKPNKEMGIEDHRGIIWSLLQSGDH
jgi:hypothetical protein